MCGSFVYYGKVCGGSKVEDFVERSLLFDFYGELLTEHQRKIYSEIVFEDYSVSEIAREEGISRQGVHDLRKRCDRILEDYEGRMHLVERFVRIREQIKKIRNLTMYSGKIAEESEDRDNCSEAEPAWKTSLREIDRIAASILEEL